MIIMASEKSQNEISFSFLLLWQKREATYYSPNNFHIFINEIMLETDIRKIDFWGKNILKSHSVNLDTDLDCVILISAKDPRLLDLLYHKIVDSIIDRIHPKNVYKDFSSALENINAFLLGWMHEWERIKWLHAIVGVYDKKTFLFSSIGAASCYLHNSHGDVIEITEREDFPKDFGFISSGDVAEREALILSTVRLLDTLSKDDIKDSLLSGTIQRAGENIEHILLHEHDGKNIALVWLKKEVASSTESSIFDKISYGALRMVDNNFFKKLLWYIYILRDKLFIQTKKTKQIVLAWGIMISGILLYFLVSWFFHVASSSPNLDESKQNLVQAQNYIITASENMNDADVFWLNIEWAKTIITDLENKNLFLNDIGKLKDDMWVLQKQFNGISPFETDAQSLVYEFSEPMDVVKILGISNRIYTVHTKSVTGPILQGEESQNFIFEGLSDDDEFIDAAVYGTDIIIMTKGWKIVSFSKANDFSYIDVSDQPTWSKSPIISTYADNLYLISDAGNQILRHKRNGKAYDAGVAYLTDADAADIGSVLSLAVDGWIYILKKDGSIVKLFRSPQYRLEQMNLAKLPKNYDFRNIDSKNPPIIKTRLNLKYVYMLLNDKILIFRPNSLRYQDVKALTYLWQIEGKSMTIEDFYIDNDGELFIAGTSGVHRLEFDVVEDKIILK